MLSLCMLGKAASAPVEIGCMPAPGGLRSRSLADRLHSACTSPNNSSASSYTVVNAEDGVATPAAEALYAANVGCFIPDTCRTCLPTYGREVIVQRVFPVPALKLMLSIAAGNPIDTAAHLQGFAGACRRAAAPAGQPLARCRLPRPTMAEAPFDTAARRRRSRSAAGPPHPQSPRLTPLALNHSMHSMLMLLHRQSWRSRGEPGPDRRGRTR